MDRLDCAIKDIKFGIEYTVKEISKLNKDQELSKMSLDSYLLGLKNALHIMENLGMDK